jgi:hypothetical protein
MRIMNANEESGYTWNNMPVGQMISDQGGESELARPSKILHGACFMYEVSQQFLIFDVRSFFDE